jgi:hypothetical protein
MDTMVDPTLGTVASAAAKLGSAVVGRYSPAGQPRVGAREERRQVYTRFQEAVVTYVMQIRDSRVSPESIGLEPRERKPYIDALMAATTEMAKALYEVRLVGNPAAINAAESVREAVTQSFDAAATARRSLTSDEAAAYASAMNNFTSACRIDLWYQPRWWQLWRGGWWKMRLRRFTKQKQAAGGQGQAVVSAYASGRSVQTNTFGPHDVVFGAADKNVRSGIPGNIANTMGSISGVVFGGEFESRGAEEGNPNPEPDQKKDDEADITKT